MEDLIFRSKEQAIKLKEIFVERYGINDGIKKYDEVLKRSPKLEDLPDRIEPKIKPPKMRFNVSRRFGRRWRGI